MMKFHLQIAMTFLTAVALGCGSSDKEQVAETDANPEAKALAEKIEKKLAEDKSDSSGKTDDDGTPIDPFATPDDDLEESDAPKEKGAVDPKSSSTDDPFAPPGSKEDKFSPPVGEPTPADPKGDPDDAKAVVDRFPNPFDDGAKSPPEPQISDLLTAPPGKQRVAAQLEQLKDKAAKVADLDFRGAEISPDDLEPVVSATKPVYLRLGETDIDNRSLNALRDAGELRGLGLNDTRVTDQGLSHVAKLSKLRGLRLDDTQVTDAGLKRLSGLTDLEWLDLEGTATTDEGLAHLAGLENLERLSLTRTKISDEGLKHLAAMTKLEWLLLDSTPVTDAGLANLKGMASLKGINLRNTKTTKEGADELRKALPNVEIYQ